MTKRAEEEREIATALRARLLQYAKYNGDTKDLNQLMGAYIELQRWREDNNEVNDDDDE